ncbi:hypothetical protein DY000_02008103 [Brassica cretica]|uniref:Uncharacterized protein n=1 Tax=Brassica cretica TaxID=69181 RepID=A0ABQ7C9M9_BRACR|nr:hypothetical protein DY000_02008103 [Brassica cretica]
MISRIWEPGIGVRAWFGVFGHDQDLDMAYQGCNSGRLRIDLGFKKGIYGILRKVKIWIEGRWISITITKEFSINTGCIMNCGPLVSCSHLIGRDLNHQRLIWVLRFFEEARSGDINLQGYGIAGVYYWNENMENWERYNKMTGTFL